MLLSAVVVYLLPILLRFALSSLFLSSSIPSTCENLSIKHSSTVQAETSNCATIDITGDIYPGTYEEVSLVGKRADYHYVPERASSTSSSYSVAGTISLYYAFTRRRFLAGDEQEGDADIQGSLSLPSRSGQYL